MTDRSKTDQMTSKTSTQSAEPTVDVETDPLFASLFAEAETLETEAEAAVADLLG